MSYIKLTDFASKDALLTGNPSKLLRGTELGAEFDAIEVADALNIKPDTVTAATGKTTPVDADLLTLFDSASTFSLKKLTWANLKATVKTYFDTLYARSGANTDITSMTGLSNGGIPLAKVSGAAASGANNDITSLNAPSLGAANATSQAVGNSTTKVATTAFVNPAFSLSFSGYVKLPSGLIVQWMPFTTSGGAVAITWPIAFPSAIYGVVASTLNGTNVVTTVNTQSIVAASIFTHVGSTGAGISNTGFVIAVGV